MADFQKDGERASSHNTKTLCGPQQLTEGFKVYLALQRHHFEKQKPKIKNKQKKSNSTMQLKMSHSSPAAKGSIARDSST